MPKHWGTVGIVWFTLCGLVLLFAPQLVMATHITAPEPFNNMRMRDFKTNFIQLPNGNVRVILGFRLDQIPTSFTGFAEMKASVRADGRTLNEGSFLIRPGVTPTYDRAPFYFESDRYRPSGTLTDKVTFTLTYKAPDGHQYTIQQVDVPKQISTGSTDRADRNKFLQGSVTASLGIGVDGKTVSKLAYTIRPEAYTIAGGLMVTVIDTSNNREVYKWNNPAPQSAEVNSAYVPTQDTRYRFEVRRPGFVVRTIYDQQTVSVASNVLVKLISSADSKGGATVKIIDPEGTTKNPKDFGATQNTTPTTLKVKPSATKYKLVFEHKDFAPYTLANQVFNQNKVIEGALVGTDDANSIRVEIRSIPEGADVWVDDSLKGKAPYIKTREKENVTRTVKMVYNGTSKSFSYSFASDVIVCWSFSDNKECPNGEVPVPQPSPGDTNGGSNTPQELPNPLDLTNCNKEFLFRFPPQMLEWAVCQGNNGLKIVQHTILQWAQGIPL